MSKETPKKERRWMRVLLAVSLGLNLAVAGMVVGAAFRFKDHRRERGAMPPSLSVMLFRDLDHETRRAMSRAASGEHGSSRRQREADRAALFAALQADPFEIDAVAAVLERSFVHQQEFRETLRAAWLERLEGMTGPQRQALVERLQSRPHHPHRRGHWGKPGAAD